MNAAKREEIFSRLQRLNPQPATELQYRAPFELLVAVVLSAQATDKSVNLVTPRLFAAASSPAAMLALGQDGLEAYIKTIGLYRTKARNLLAACRMLLERYGGEVPREREALVELPGVGLKTANVVIGNAFGGQALTVDTHVFRVSQRLGLARADDPDEIHDQLVAILPPESLTHASHLMITHGRRTCVARKPLCPACPVRALCPWAHKTQGPGRG